MRNKTILDDKAVVFNFMRDITVGDTRCRLLVKEIYRVYCAYCQSVGTRPVSIQTFSKYFGVYYHNTLLHGKVHYWCRLRDDIWEAGDVQAI